MRNVFKSNRIEIWNLVPEAGLVMVHSKPIYGTISMLQKIRPHGSKTDHLFVGTLRFQYFTVAWDPETRQLDTVQSFLDISEKHMRDSESRDRCLVDPKGQYLVMELYEGILSLVKKTKPRKGNNDYLDKPEQIRITELDVRASAFLHTDTNRPKLALLYAEGEDVVRLATYRVVDEKLRPSNFIPHKDRENDIGDLDLGACLLIPVSKGAADQKKYIVRNQAAAKAQLGGVIIVGETRMTYLDDESKAIVEYYLSEAALFVAWEQVDDLQYILSDEYGYLQLLTIIVDGVVVTGMSLNKIGRAPKATALIYLGNGLLFVGSHVGDSQLLSVNADGEGFDLLQTIPNIAPILDFAVMDMGNREGETASNEYSSGQARLVTGSGANQEGSLRSVRSGVGLDDIGILADIKHIQAVFALRSSPQSPSNDILLVSLLLETRIFQFDADGGIEEIDAHEGLSLDSPTLLATNLDQQLILQITPTIIQVSNVSGSGTIAKWQPPEGYLITASSANSRSILVAVNGRILISLDSKLDEITTRDLGDDDQVACIHVPEKLCNVAVVGFWKSGAISILNLTNLNTIHSENLRRKDNASVPRNIVLTQVLPEATSGPTLFVAMEDGIVQTFNVDKHDYTLSSRKRIVLGTQQAQFQILPRKDGLTNIFVTCEHPSLIYGSEGRIVYSAVTAEAAVCVCSFDSEAYPDSIVVATAENIKIAQIDKERRTHVRSLHMGENVRRIAYSANERAFGIGCIKRYLDDGVERVSSSFRLVDEVMFADLGKIFPLDMNDGWEMIECVTRAELPIDEDSNTAERFLVGTSYTSPEKQGDDVRGRILVFGVDSDRSPFLITSHILRGACRRIAIMGDKIIAALTKTVVIYRFHPESNISGNLDKLATYRTSTCPIDLDIIGNIIVVADLMKSISLVEYKPGENGLEDRLNEIGRHQQSCWATATVHLEDDSYLESDQEGNLLVLKRNLTGVTYEDRLRLDVTSEMNLGEQVNMIRKINVETSASAVVIPKAFLATVSQAEAQNKVPRSTDDVAQRASVECTTVHDLKYADYMRPEMIRFDAEHIFPFENISAANSGQEDENSLAGSEEARVISVDKDSDWDVLTFGISKSYFLRCASRLDMSSNLESEGNIRAETQSSIIQGVGLVSDTTGFRSDVMEVDSNRKSEVGFDHWPFLIPILKLKSRLCFVLPSIRSPILKLRPIRLITESKANENQTNAPRRAEENTASLPVTDRPKSREDSGYISDNEPKNRRKLKT
ncbi:hypothetical protein B7494_g6546 [Chlorociboria aeruginascens]|nr:hypothetical protein B7494_g6546 [Chlorociboria aeruginascens]